MLVHFSGAAANFSGKIDPAPLQKMARTPVMHAKFCSSFWLVQVIGLSITHIKALIAVTVAGCCKKKL